MQLLEDYNTKIPRNMRILKKDSNEIKFVKFDIIKENFQNKVPETEQFKNTTFADTLNEAIILEMVDENELSSIIKENQNITHNSRQLYNNNGKTSGLHKEKKYFYLFSNLKIPIL